MASKVDENRLRRMAQRQGLVLQKSARRDPKAKDFGRYRLLVDHRDLFNPDVQALPFTQTFNEVKIFLESANEGLDD